MILKSCLILPIVIRSFFLFYFLESQGKKERPRLIALTRLGKAHNRTKSRAVKKRLGLVYYFCEYLAVSLKKYLYNAAQEDGYVMLEIVVMSFYLQSLFHNCLA